MRYACYLAVDGGEQVPVNVVITDAHRLQFDMAGQGAGLRDKITQPFMFTRGDGYEIIREGSYGSEFTFTINTRNLDGSETLFHVGTFSWANCRDFNEDQGTVLATLEPDDDERRFLDNLNTEYDFISLGARRVSVRYNLYPKLQLYAMGSDRMLEIQLGQSYYAGVTPQVTEDELATLTNDFGFGAPFRIGYVPNSLELGDYSAAAGVYFFDEYDVLEAGAFRLETYRWNHQYNDFSIITNHEVNNGVASDSAILFIRSTNETIYLANATRLRPRFPANNPIELTSIDDDTLRVRFQAIDVVGRLLTNQAAIAGQTAEELDINDPLVADRNYKNSVPIDIVSVVPSVATSPIDQNVRRYATNALGPQAGQFVAARNNNSYQILPSSWTDLSWWYDLPQNLQTPLQSVDRVINVQDAFTLSSVMDLVANEASGGRVRHPSTSETSELLYGDIDPYTGVAPYTLIVVPKSNVTVIDYTEAAGRGPIRMRDLIDLMRTIRNSNWRVREGTLQIEHNRFFHLGGSYDAQNVGLDLTLLIDRWSCRPWDTDQTIYSFRNDELFERITFGQMDDVSEAFKGEPIELISRAAQGGGEDERLANMFTFDLNYVLAQPSSVSERGYMLLACRWVPEDGTYEVATTGVGFRILQNGPLSFPQIQFDYYRECLPAPLARFQGRTWNISFVKRTKEQQISMPVSAGLNRDQLLRTKLGNGLISRGSINMNSGEAQITILHEPE